MHDFAVIALMALAIVKVVDFLGDSISGLHRMRSLLTFVLGIGGMFLLDYSVFDGWNIAVRDHNTGIWMTGFIVAGCTVAWRAIFGYLTHDKAMGDESLGAHTGLRRAA